MVVPLDGSVGLTLSALVVGSGQRRVVPGESRPLDRRRRPLNRLEGMWTEREGGDIILWILIAGLLTSSSTLINVIHEFTHTSLNRHTHTCICSTY